MTARDIELHIENIALTAMPAGGERRLREAVQRELARLARAAGGEWLPRTTAPRDRPVRKPSEAAGDGAADSVAARIGRDVHAHLSGKADA